MLQTRLVELSSYGVCIVNLRAVDFLERIHGANGANQLKIGVITEQIPREVESQWRGTVRRHEITNLQAHFPEVLICQRVGILLVLKAQHRVLVLGSKVCPGTGYAQADDRWLVEVLFVSAGVDEALE